MGKLKITKRGSGIARKFLYLAALRLIKDDAVAAAWYRNRKCYRAELKKKAVVAVMRKLVRALFHVARGSAFDSTKLFDTRRLSLEANAEDASRITSYNVCYTKLLRHEEPEPRRAPNAPSETGRR